MEERSAMDLTGASHELDFWRGFVQTPRFLDLWCGDFPTPELQSEVKEFLLERPEAKVLDVGSGVVSLLHGTARNLTAVDPLGDRYAGIFDYAAHGIEQPQAIAVEDLEFVEEFDVVHMSNALDHCQHPFDGLVCLMVAARPGGWLIVQGFENEATAMSRAGMHQWDLRVEGRTLICDTLHLAEGDRAFTHAIPGGRRWFVWMKQK